ncbi:MAG: hypothetical protein ACRDRH_17995 [Pseudonocardia sp.]
MTAGAAPAEDKVNSNVIVRAFDAVSGDYAGAVSRAKGFSFTGGWVAWQASQAAAAGAAALAVPAAHLAAMVADVAFLMHKMSYCCWGIGAITGAPVDGKDDFEIILAYWSGDLKENELPVAIVTGTMAGAAAFIASQYTIAQVTGKLTSLGVNAVAAGAAKKLGNKALAKTLVKATGKVGGKVAGAASGQFIEKAAAKISLKIGGKIGGKAMAGFIPFVGPMIGAGINAYFVKDIADAAKVYYRKKKEITAAY